MVEAAAPSSHPATADSLPVREDKEDRAGASASDPRPPAAPRRRAARKSAAATVPAADTVAGDGFDWDKGDDVPF